MSFVIIFPSHSEFPTKQKEMAKQVINKGLIASYVLATFFPWTFATLKFFSFYKTSAHKRWQKRPGKCLINGISES